MEEAIVGDTHNNYSNRREKIEIEDGSGLTCHFVNLPTLTWENISYTSWIGTLIGTIHEEKFNRNTIKINYSSTNNMHNILNNLNGRIRGELNRNSGGPDEVFCNYRRKGECLLGGRCNSKNIVYWACISPIENNKDGEKVYIGTSDGNCKQRMYNHRHSFSNPWLRNQTNVSKFFGTLKIRG